MGMSQMCTGAGDYFRTSKPHSEKLCTLIGIDFNTAHCSHSTLTEAELSIMWTVSRRKLKFFICFYYEKLYHFSQICCYGY